MALPISIEKLLSGEVVESSRIEYEGIENEKVVHDAGALARTHDRLSININSFAREILDKYKDSKFPYGQA